MYSVSMVSVKLHDTIEQCSYTVCPAVDICFVAGDPKIIEEFSAFDTHNDLNAQISCASSQLLSKKPDKYTDLECANSLDAHVMRADVVP